MEEQRKIENALGPRTEPKGAGRGDQAGGPAMPPLGGPLPGREVPRPGARGSRVPSVPEPLAWPLSGCSSWRQVFST